MNNSTEAFTPGDTPSESDSGAVDFITALRMTAMYRAIPTLYSVWGPCILVLGTFGNVATVMVLRRLRDQHSSQHVFLMSLAVVDLVYLVFALLEILQNTQVMVFFSLHTVTCKLNYFLRFTISTLSAWLVTAVTIQRTLAVTWPHRVRVLCTVRRTWWVVAALTVMAAALGFHFLITWFVNDVGYCSYYHLPSYVYYIRFVNTWMSMSAASVIPFVFLVLCDIVLSRSLFQASAASQALSSAVVEEGDNSREETAKRTTIMILVLSITFLILTLPVQIVVTWHNYGRTQIRMNPWLFALMRLLNRTGRLLRFTNSAINFFLYCFTGTRFRQEFVCMITGRPAQSSSRKPVAGG